MKFIFALICLFVLGCSTPHNPQKSYAVKDFTLILMDRDMIRKQYKTMYGIDDAYIAGYCDQKARVIFVAYDETGKPMLDILGHEVWHLLELGGGWHK